MVEEGEQSDEEEKNESSNSNEKKDANQEELQTFNFIRPSNRFKNNNVITPVVGGKKGGNFLSINKVTQSQSYLNRIS